MVSSRVTSPSKMSYRTPPELRARSWLALAGGSARTKQGPWHCHIGLRRSAQGARPKHVHKCGAGSPQHTPWPERERTRETSQGPAAAAIHSAESCDLTTACGDGFTAKTDCNRKTEQIPTDCGRTEDSRRCNLLEEQPPKRVLLRQTGSPPPEQHRPGHHSRSAQGCSLQTGHSVHAFCSQLTLSSSRVESQRSRNMEQPGAIMGQSEIMRTSCSPARRPISRGAADDLVQ